MNWIINYIVAHQIMYPNMGETPAATLSHLLFCNGNGIDIKDGVFISVNFKTRKITPFSTMYVNLYDKTESIEVINDMLSESKITEHYEFLKRVKSVYGYTDEECMQKAQEKFYGRYDKVLWADDPDVDLSDKEQFKKQILSNGYRPYLSLSDEYYKAYFFNENTEKELLVVTRAMALAYIDVMTEIMDNKHPDLKAMVPVTDGEQERVYKNDIKQLKKVVTKMESLLKDQALPVGN